MRVLVVGKCRPQPASPGYEWPLHIGAALGLIVGLLDRTYDQGAYRGAGLLSPVTKLLL